MSSITVPEERATHNTPAPVIRLHPRRAPKHWHRLAVPLPRGLLRDIERRALDQQQSVEDVAMGALVDAALRYRRERRAARERRLA